jgi:hypothetical protein
MHCHKCVLNLTIGCNTSSGILSISSHICILRSCISGHVFYTLPKQWRWPTLVCKSWNHMLWEYVAYGSQTLCKQCGLRLDLAGTTKLHVEVDHLSFGSKNVQACCMLCTDCDGLPIVVYTEGPITPRYEDAHLWTVQRPLMKFSEIFHGSVMEVLFSAPVRCKCDSSLINKLLIKSSLSFIKFNKIEQHCTNSSLLTAGQLLEDLLCRDGNVKILCTGQTWEA